MNSDSDSDYESENKIHTRHKQITNIDNKITLGGLKERKVNKDILELLISEKFIQLDDHSIACLPRPGNSIKIIEISQNNLIKRDSVSIKFQSPLD